MQIPFPLRPLLMLPVLLISVPAIVPAQFREFLHQAQTMILVRKLPPIINVKEASFKIEASSTSHSVPPDVVNTLITKTRGLLLKDRERSLRLDDSNPTYTLRCKVTGFEMTEQRSTEGTGAQTLQYLRVIGTIEATIEVVDSSKGALDSDNLKSHFEREYLLGGTGGFSPFNALHKDVSKERIPTELERRDLIVEGLAAKVAQRLVSVEEQVEIQLPIAGSFKEMQELARRKRWVELEEAAEKMPAPKKAEDDSYRLYMVGLVNEGLAYDKANTEPDVAKTLLTKALSSYSDAKEKKPRETYFLQPEIRAQESIDSYLAIDRFKKMAGVARPTQANRPEAPKPEAPKQAAAPAQQSEEWNNQALINLKKQNLPDSTLITLIKASPNPRFDVSAKGIQELAIAGISGPVIEAIVAKMQAPAAASPRPPAAPRAAIPAPAPAKQ